MNGASIAVDGGLVRKPALSPSMAPQTVPLELILPAGSFAISRLAADSPILPGRRQGPFFSVTGLSLEMTFRCQGNLLPPELWIHIPRRSALAAACDARV